MCDKTKNATFRAWCFTLNNYTDAELERIAKPYDEVKYIAYSKEVGAEGTPHLQGYVIMWTAVRMTWFKRYLPHAHLEPMYGRLLDNETYCTKQNTLTEYGQRPEQGRRTDLISVKRALDGGSRTMSLAEDEAFFPIVAKHERFFSKYEHYKRAKTISVNRDVPNVYVRIGPSGTGKTRFLDDTYGPGNWARMPNPTSSWWITESVSYCDTVLIDDIGPSKVPKIEEFLEWTDRYPVEFNSKGGHLWWKPKNIIITSNCLPSEWWPKMSEEHQAAIHRRITSITYVGFDGEVDVTNG